MADMPLDDPAPPPDANDDDVDADEDTCPICLAQFETASPLESAAAADIGSGSALTTACGHRFCVSCLRMASHRVPRSLACAICRGRIHDCTEHDDSCALCRAGVASLMDMDRDIDYAPQRRMINVGICIALPYASMFACAWEDFCPVHISVSFLEYATIGVVGVYVVFRLWIMYNMRAVALANSSVRNIRGHERIVPAEANHERPAHPGAAVAPAPAGSERERPLPQVV